MHNNATDPKEGADEEVADVAPAETPEPGDDEDNDESADDDEG